MARKIDKKQLKAARKANYYAKRSYFVALAALIFTVVFTLYDGWGTGEHASQNPDENPDENPADEEATDNTQNPISQIADELDWVEFTAANKNKLLITKHAISEAYFMGFLEHTNELDIQCDMSLNTDAKKSKPIVGISWSCANLFASKLGEAEQSNIRLPTLDELNSAINSSKIVEAENLENELTGDCYVEGEEASVPNSKEICAEYKLFKPRASYPIRVLKDHKGTKTGFRLVK